MTTEQVEGRPAAGRRPGLPLQVRFTGGEPLLRPDFEELYLFARRLGLAVLLFTNARRVTPGLADLLARMPPREPVEVTVYGMHRESYEAVSRVPGSYAQFRRGVDLLLERGVPFVVKGVLLPPNRGEMDEFEAWAATLPGMTEPPSYVVFLDLRNRRDDAEKNRLIASLRLSPEEARGRAHPRRGEVPRRDGRVRARASWGRPAPSSSAAAPATAVSIDAYGRAQPCMGVRAPELTVDVLPASLATTLWSASPACASCAPPNPEYLRRCARCFLHGFCEQCPAKSWTEHGTLDTPVEYLCEVAHAQARYLGWLKADEKAWEVADWSKNGRS